MRIYDYMECSHIIFTKVFGNGFFLLLPLLRNKNCKDEIQTFFYERQLKIDATSGKSRDVAAKWAETLLGNRAGTLLGNWKNYSKISISKTPPLISAVWLTE